MDIFWNGTFSGTTQNNEGTLYLFVMIGPGQSGDDPVLQPGDYSYPFQFVIPNQNMPTSVEGSHGYVRYWLKGIIDRPWKFDITTTAVFTMLEYVDINTLPLLVSHLHFW